MHDAATCLAEHGDARVPELGEDRLDALGAIPAETIAAIKEQGGLVYLPHPFDRMHAIPFPMTLHRHLHEFDVFEVYNARLLFETYNDEALRFARKYNLTMGAGSDAHVLQGVVEKAAQQRQGDLPEAPPARRARHDHVARLAAQARAGASAEDAAARPSIAALARMREWPAREAEAHAASLIERASSGS